MRLPAMSRRRLLMVLLATTSIPALAGEAPSQPGSQAAAPQQTAAIENVVVTAQKRSQRVQDIPLTISVLDARKLAKLDVISTDQLAQYVPALEIATPSGRGNQPLINIRGIGLNDTNTNNAGPNGVYVDEVYQASPAGQTFQTFDLARVEVLKGPQGTLYGRNTTGGAINYVTNHPTDQFFASEDLQYGSWNTASTETTVNGPLSPTVNARGTIFYNYSDGYFTDLTDNNKTNGDNNISFRGELSWQASDDLSLLFNVHGGTVERRPDEYRFVGTLTGPGSSTQCATPAILAGSCTDLFGYKGVHDFYSGKYNRDENLYINADGGYVRADYQVGAVSLSSISALEISHKEHPEDTDADPYELLQIDYGVRSTDFSEELHASGSGTGYHWLTGFYALDETLKQDQRLALFNDIDQVSGVPGLGDGLAEQARTLNGQSTQSEALFGQGDYTVLPGLRMTLGGRLTYEHKSFDATSLTSFQQNSQGDYSPLSSIYNVQEAISARAASWRAALDYRISPSILTYGSVSTGFKSGGFNGGFLANDAVEALDQLKPIKPEYITAYEIGLHSDPLGGRARVNAALFYYKYRDLQIYNIIDSPLSTGGDVLPLSVLTNAPTATIKGAEWEFDYNPTRNLTTSAQIAYTDAVLGPFVSSDGGTALQNLTGKWLPNAPRWDVVLGTDYSVPIAYRKTLDFGASAKWRTKQFFDSTDNPLTMQPAYWVVDLRATLAPLGNKWSVSVIVKNLTGTKYLNFANNLSQTFGILEEIVGPPRFVGGEVKFRF